MKTTITILFLLLSLSTSIRWATAAGWPTTGGNSQHNGQATVAGPSMPQILWTRPDPGFGVGSQVYVEGDRMVTRRQRDSAEGVVVCYDLLTGEELWSRQFSSAGRAFPVGFHGGRIYAVDYTFSGFDDLYALDPDDGSTLWIAPGRANYWEGVGLTFTTDGDLLVPSRLSLARLDATDGSILWETPVLENSGHTLRLGIYEETVYSIESPQPNLGAVLVARDTATGVTRTTSALIPPAGGQTLPMFLGPDGSIYLVRDDSSQQIQQRIHAFEDTGSGLVERWNAPIASRPWLGRSAVYGVGVDGSLIVVSEDGRSLVRRDPTTGALLSVSDPLTASSILLPRVTVGSMGTIYATVDSTVPGEPERLYVMDSDLAIRWSLPYPGALFNGPAVAENGLLALAGSSSVTVYATDRELLIDGFEGGDSSAWNTVPAVPDPLQNYVNVAEKAALDGSNYGLVVKVQDSASETYVESTEPDGERTFTARFWLDPSQLDIAPYAGNSIFTSLNILKARMDVGGSHMFLFLSRAPRAAKYRLDAVVSEEFGLSVAASIELTSITTPVPAQIQLEWRAATGIDAEDGLIRLTHLGTGESDLRRDLDNHGYVIDAVQIGAFGNGQGAVSGSYFFDEYESFR